MQTTEEKVDTSKALDAILVNTKNSRTELGEQATSSRSGNDAHADDADIRPIYDEEPIAEIQTTAETNVFAIGQQHIEQPEFNNEGEKCVFNANHDSCVTKFLNEVNSRAKVPSNETTNINKPVEKTSFAKKPKRQIPKGHRFSIKKTFVVHAKTMTPRSCLRWKPTGKIFKTVGLRWVPTGKIFTSITTKVDSEPTNGSNGDITNQYECEQTLDVSAGCGFCEEVWILLSDLILTFSCELRTSPRVPPNLDNWDTALLQPFDFSIYDFYWFLDEMKLVINIESIQ
nr:hypothetical protein [Tanacetum cinerariifolium]